MGNKGATEESRFNYTGTENLEIMAEAVNYNAYLSQLVFEHTSKYKRIVDFGSGIGTFAESLRNAGRDITCIEPDSNQYATLVGLGFRCCADIAELPDESVDAIYTLNVLEHIPDDMAALRKLYAKLAPGGGLLIYVPAFQILFSSMDEKVGHCRRYNRSDLTEKIRAAGFHVHESRYVDSLGFPASIAYKLFGSRSGEINRSMLKIYDRFVFPISCTIDRLTGRWFGKNLLIIADKLCTTTTK